MQLVHVHVNKYDASCSVLHKFTKMRAMTALRKHILMAIFGQRRGHTACKYTLCWHAFWNPPSFPHHRLSNGNAHFCEAAAKYVDQQKTHQNESDRVTATSKSFTSQQWTA